MKIQKLELLNESADRFVCKATGLLREKFDDDQKVTFIISYDDKDDNPVVFKKFSSPNPLRKNVAALLSADGFLDKCGATALYVDSSTGKPMFTAYRNDDGSWDIVEDKIDEVLQQSLPYEYRDVLLNRVYYSLTGSVPENLKLKSPSLYNNIIRAKRGTYVADGDESGYQFNKNGDAVIGISIDRLNSAEEKKIADWVEEVANHFGCELRKIGRKSFRIIVPDQEKLFDD